MPNITYKSILPGTNRPLKTQAVQGPPQNPVPQRAKGLKQIQQSNLAQIASQQKGPLPTNYANGLLQFVNI